MLKSLFSGVSGLQSHQIAMDVESNNIANVNTIGYKYSRANFSDLLAQTNQIATAPQGALGGKNAMQVGLGTSVNSVTRIHSQGSIQNTDKNTDVAIQGDGFFIVSSDGGSTYKYSRSGDFKFDAVGNFVDNNGFIVQGWSRDQDTGKVDATAPIANIQIPPGLTTPANASTEIVLKANLNSSLDQVTQYAPVMQQSSAGGGATGTIVDKYGRTDDGTPASLFNFSDDEIGNMGAMFDATGKAFNIKGATGGPALTALGGGQGIIISLDGGLTYQAFRYTDVGTIPTPPTATTPATAHNIDAPELPDGSGPAAVNGDIFYFRSTEDLRKSLEVYLNNATNGSTNAIVEINEQGKFVLKNPDVAGTTLSLKTLGITEQNVTVNNPIFTDNFTTIAGSLTAGPSSTPKSSMAVNMATHSASIDIYDSLGSKHTIKVDFTKIGTSNSGGAKWSYIATAPSYADIDGTSPYKNIMVPTGEISFDDKGALSNVTIPSITFTANNGSEKQQTINLEFGSIGKFDGITSFDNPSSTSGISQDGYPGGDLQGIRIDQSGTLVGSFSNGRSFGLAQIGMAKFANNEGLVGDGSNVYLQSANSGNPIIGTAATAGRGFMQSAALEASNVDLSKSLTNLIIIQRGYQANGKTITTSDTLLETLIGLKR